MKQRLSGARSTTNKVTDNKQMITRVKGFWKHLNVTPEKFFLIVGGIFGLLLIGITPPLQTPDEATHFLRAYQVSQLGFVGTNDDGVIGGYLPVSFEKTQALVDTEPVIEFNPGAKYNLHKTIAALKIDLDENTTEFETVGGAVTYSPVGYIPQAIGIAIGVLLNLPPILLMYIARVANLIVWLLLIYGAIKLLPYKKWALVGVALLPMLVAQSGSPGVDMLSIGLATVFITYILKLRAQSLVSNKSLLFIFLLGCAIALTKQTTILVLGFVFLLKMNQFSGTRTKTIMTFIALIMVPILVSIGWGILTSHLNLVAAAGVPGQNSSQQLIGLINEPWRLPKVIFNTFFFDWGDGVVGALIGSFGWLDTPLSSGLVMIGYVTLAFLLFTNYEKPKLPLRRTDVWVITSILALYVVGTMAALYITYAPVGFGVFYGLQGRYFLLALIMAIPLFWSTPIKIAKQHYVTFLKVAMVTLLIASALTIYLRYYVTVVF